jgi:hypothetical protein
MHNKPSSVADNLRSTSKSDQARKSPLLPAIALVQVDQHAGAEDSDEESVCGQVRLVLEDGPFDGAFFEGAFAPAALLGVVGRHRWIRFGEGYERLGRRRSSMVEGNGIDVLLCYAIAVDDEENN